MRRILLALSGLLLLCTPWAQAASGDLAGSARAVGVMVLAGHELELTRIGQMVFWNNRSVVAAPDDALMELTFQLIKKQIELEGRAEVARVNVHPADLPVLAAKAFEGSHAFFGPNISSMAEQLKPYRAGCACDVLLVVAMDRNELLPNIGPQVKGFAWVGYSGFDEDVRRSAAGVHLVLHLVDAATGNVLESARNITDYGTYDAPRDAHGAIWAREMNAIGPDAWSSLISAYGADLSRTLRRPLFKLGLKPSCTRHYYDIQQERYGATRPYSNVPVPPLVLPERTDPSRC